KAVEEGRVTRISRDSYGRGERR
ncbi:MAG: hypothetical protein QOJ57_1206, partial [Thermoleophilaceae bacterium]|nr:hypothetical protein [Thermoleophilaceae bacterium]